MYHYVNSYSLVKFYTYLIDSYAILFKNRKGYFYGTRKKKGNIVVIIILAVALCASLGFILYDYVLRGDVSTSDTSKSNLNDKNKVDKRNDSRPKEIDVNGRLVKYLYNKVVDSKTIENPYWMYEGNDNFSVSTATEEQKMRLVSINLNKSKEQWTNCEGAPQQYGDYVTSCSLLNSGTAYSKEYIEYVYKDLFGQDAILNTNSNMVSNVRSTTLYKYIQNSDSYIEYTVEAGGTSSMTYKSTITKASKSNIEVKLYEHTELIDQTNPSNNKTADYIYTFSIDEDDMYSFVSRIKE